MTTETEKTLKGQKMDKLGRRLVILILLSAALVLVAGCSSRFEAQSGEETNLPSSNSPSPGKPTNGLVQTNNKGGVTVEFEWAKAGDSSLSFNVVMDTHSVNLDQYDLAKLAVLRDDTGKEYRPVAWNGAPGGHHRQGVLTFPLPESLKEGKAKFIELVVRNVAGVQERVLKWAL